jgi:hypothetical protein
MRKKPTMQSIKVHLKKIIISDYSRRHDMQHLTESVPPSKRQGKLEQSVCRPQAVHITAAWAALKAGTVFI